MKLNYLLQNTLLISKALAILPEAKIINNEQELGLQSSYSLPNLLKINDVSDLHSEWDIKGSMVFEAGRLIVKEDKGAIWSRQLLRNSQDEWTIDLVFRNSEQENVDDHSFYDTNGFSFWLLDQAVPSDVSNFGGPKRFDGLQFLINNLDYKGLKIFANDGTKNIVNSEANALGGCRLNYLDSMVPFTLRISYSAQKNWFKVQIDNNLCFSTDALTLRGIASDLHFGVSASTNSISKEYWEILKINVFDKLSEDAIDDHDVVNESPIKYVTRAEESQPTSQPQQKFPSLMERNMQQQVKAKAAAAAAAASAGAPKLDQLDSSLSDIISKLAGLEKMVNAFDATKIIDLSSAIEGIKQIQSQQSVVLSELKSTYENFEKLLASHYKEITESVRSSNQEVINEMTGQHSDVVTLSKKVDLLMSNHRDIQNQYQKLDSKSTESEFLSTIVRWVFIPLVVGIVAVIVVVYRLKKDIKHSKLL